ncbi:(NiFe) hydrogenase assembly chaperone, HybE family [Burkholderiales bacterium JOSHI_001]|nr:(NiFe) hydrogenase assembly chaperone, HybE family [Burkholderiales bacterium JOSHI_001]
MKHPPVAPSAPPPLGGAPSGPAEPDPRRLLGQRVETLERAFAEIGRTRMAGLPMLHPKLKVQALGFQELDDEPLAWGILVTPWFMNLMRLPLADGAAVLPVGEVAERDVGPQRMQFIGANEPAIGGCGRYEMCSLFSPMNEFIDHEAAVATAREVLALLRPTPAAAIAAPLEVPARRGFLFGRSALRGPA